MAMSASHKLGIENKKNRSPGNIKMDLKPSCRRKIREFTVLVAETRIYRM